MPGNLFVCIGAIVHTMHMCSTLYSVHFVASQKIRPSHYGPVADRHPNGRTPRVYFVWPVHKSQFPQKWPGRAPTCQYYECKYRGGGNHHSDEAYTCKTTIKSHFVARVGFVSIVFYIEASVLSTRLFAFIGDDIPISVWHAFFSHSSRRSMRPQRQTNISGFHISGSRIVHNVP